MIIRTAHNVVGGLVTLALSLGLLSQQFVQSPHDIAGVGSSGTIGRGTIPEERHAVAIPLSTTQTSTTVNRSSPVVVAPVEVSVAPARPSIPTPTSNRPRANPARVPASEPALVRINPYRDYHRSWLHGYWNAHHSASLSWRAADDGSGSSPDDVLARSETQLRGGGLVPHLMSRPGMGRGWGLPAWLIGPMSYNWGYDDFSNPFEETTVRVDPERRDALDYSEPVNVLAPPPDAERLQEALDRFHAARMAFRREDFGQALRLADVALRLIPNDPCIHQFRALNLIALHRYREAAATLHAVIAVVPGWDWTTMSNLYDHVETYTRQLRLLESFAEENPRSAAARFLLACQYLTTGYDQAAVAQLDIVRALQPDNHLVARLIREFRPSTPGRPPLLAIPAGSSGVLEGTWTCHPRKNTMITLIFQPHEHLIWEINRGGNVRRYEGICVSGDGTLTLRRSGQESMVGHLIWQGDHRFTFKILEDQPTDPGLTFIKS